MADLCASDWEAMRIPASLAPVVAGTRLVDQACRPPVQIESRALGVLRMPPIPSRAQGQQCCRSFYQTETAVRRPPFVILLGPALSDRPFHLKFDQSL